MESMGRNTGDRIKNFCVFALPGIFMFFVAVSYTHLDVYKRQGQPRRICGQKNVPEGRMVMADVLHTIPPVY